MQIYIHKESRAIICAVQAENHGEVHGEIAVPKGEWKLFNRNGAPLHRSLSEKAFREDYDPFYGEESSAAATSTEVQEQETSGSEIEE